VNISFEQGSLLVEIIDDGKGFEPNKVATGHGLLNIKERVSLLKGSVTIDSSPERGTILKVGIPVNKIQYDKIVAG
jgi:NarL family two-component system sensor histidine kinase YdfH